MLDSVGALDVRAKLVVAVPSGVVTVTMRVLTVAVAEMVNVAVTLVSLTALKLLTVTPVPLTVTPVAPVRPEPVIVTGTAVPCAPLDGEIDVTAGVGIVKVTAFEVPPDVVTVTFRDPRAAMPEIVNVAVMVVGLTTLTLLTATPVPDTLTAVVVSSVVPVNVTFTALPRTPIFGEMEVSVAVGTPAWSSIAPMSNRVGAPGSGRGLP
jgi:hypothetical protein